MGFALFRVVPNSIAAGHRLPASRQKMCRLIAFLALLLALAIQQGGEARADEDPCPRPRPDAECPQKSGLGIQLDSRSFWSSNGKVQKFLTDRFERNGIAVVGPVEGAITIGSMARGIPDDTSQTRDLTEFVDASGTALALYGASAKGVTRGGRILGIPIGIRMNGLIYYNQAVASQAGVWPQNWKSIDDLFQGLDKAKAIGALPLVVEDTSWAAGELFQSVLAASAGPYLVERLYGTEDISSSATEFEDALAVFRRLSDYLDVGHFGREFDVANSLVHSRNALLQIGDTRASSLAATYPSPEIACLGIPGAKGMVGVVDSLSFFVSGDAKINEAQDYVMAMADHASFQGDLARVTGSLPAVRDALVPEDPDRKNLSECTKGLKEALETADLVAVVTAPLDLQTALNESLQTFWNDGSISPLAEVQRLISIRSQFAN